MFFIPRFLKGVWRYLYQDGHEHITSCLFYLYEIMFPLEGRIHRVVPDTYQGIVLWMKTYVNVMKN